MWLAITCHEWGIRCGVESAGCGGTLLRIRFTVRLKINRCPPGNRSSHGSTLHEKEGDTFLGAPFLIWFPYTALSRMFLGQEWSWRYPSRCGFIDHQPLQLAVILVPFSIASS